MTVFNLISPPGTFFSTQIQHLMLTVRTASTLSGRHTGMSTRSAGPADHDARLGTCFQIDLSMSASICDASSLVLIGMTMEIRENTFIAARAQRRNPLHSGWKNRRRNVRTGDIPEAITSSLPLVKIMITVTAGT